jgi:pyruvate,water dikinase
MGISATRLLFAAILTLAPLAPSDFLDGPRFVVEAASRIFFDVTGALGSRFGRSVLQNMMAQAEAQAGAILRQVAADPHLAPGSTSTLRLLRALGLLLVRTRAPWTLLQALLAPATARARLVHLEAVLRQAKTVEPNADAHANLAAVERLLFDTTQRLMAASVPVMLGSMVTLGVAGKLLGDLASASELQIVLRGSPFNPTTDMNLALWTLAQKTEADPASADTVRTSSAAQLAERYLQRSLPTQLQANMATFLTIYGHRSVNELDLGVARWSEDPAYLFDVIASYLKLHDSTQTPAVQYRRAAQEAEAMLTELSDRARRRNRLRGFLVRRLLARARPLAGLREVPRSEIALMLALGRTLLRRVGQELAWAGRLERADDIFFVSLPEAHAALAGTDLRDQVRARRTSYQEELARRHVPLVLLSDGTEPSADAALEGSTPGLLRGVPVSPGSVTARARVILDPHGAQLEKGEILVAPSTDPGWTPLFPVAGGLIMETGGAISHGAIVAREYGIPAVAGVAGATERIRTGQHITVDGSTGTIRINADSEEAWVSRSSSC